MIIDGSENRRRINPFKECCLGLRLCISFLYSKTIMHNVQVEDLFRSVFLLSRSKNFYNIWSHQKFFSIYFTSSSNNLTVLKSLQIRTAKSRLLTEN